MPPRRKASSACWALLQATTRSPRVSSRTLRMERACSLSSTQRIVFLGFMGGIGSPHSAKSFFNFLRTESDVHPNGIHLRGKVARSPMALTWTERWCHALRATTAAAFSLLVREREFSAQNFYTLSTDTHIDHLVILLRRAHKNATRTVHCEAMFDPHALVAGRDTMRNHPGGATTCSGAGRRVLA